MSGGLGTPRCNFPSADVLRASFVVDAQCHLRGTHTQDGPMLGLSPDVLLSPLEILNFEQEALYFHFALGPTSYVAGPGCEAKTNDAFRSLTECV